MTSKPIDTLVALAATRPEGIWPEQLELAPFHRLLAAVAPAAREVQELPLAQRLRDEVAAVLLADDDEAACRVLNALILEHEIVPTVTPDGISHRSLRNDVSAQVWAQLIGELMSAVASGVRARVRRCTSEPCITPFVDSTAGGREYCCARCATRSRVRRHRAAQADR